MDAGAVGGQVGAHETGGCENRIGRIEMRLHDADTASDTSVKEQRARRSS